MLSCIFTVYLSIWGTAKLFSKGGLHTTLNSHQFFHTLINTYYCLFYYSHSNLYKMASYCGFDLYFPLFLMILIMFSVLIGHLYIIFYIKLFLHHLLKRLFLSPLKFLGILITNKLPSNMWASFWTLNFIPLIYMPILFPEPNDFVYFSFELMICKSSNLNFPSKIVLAILGSEFPYESHLWRRTGGVLRGIALSL